MKHRKDAATLTNLLQNQAGEINHLRGLGFRVLGLGLRVWGLRVRV